MCLRMSLCLGQLLQPWGPGWPRKPTFRSEKWEWVGFLRSHSGMPRGCRSCASSLSMTALCKWPGTVSRLPGHWPPPSPATEPWGAQGLGGGEWQDHPIQAGACKCQPKLTHLHRFIVCWSICLSTHSFSKLPTWQRQGWGAVATADTVMAHTPFVHRAPLKPLDGRTPRGGHGRVSTELKG